MLDDVHISEPPSQPQLDRHPAALRQTVLSNSVPKISLQLYLHFHIWTLPCLAGKCLKLKNKSSTWIWMTRIGRQSIEKDNLKQILCSLHLPDCCKFSGKIRNPVLLQAKNKRSIQLNASWWKFQRTLLSDYAYAGTKFGQFRSMAFSYCFHGCGT